VVRRLQHAAFNYARDYWRKQSHTVSLDDERWLEKQLVEDQESEWIERLDAERARALLPGLIAKLPPRQRKVLIARFYEEAAFEDIAVQMQIQPSSVRSLLRHGIHALRCELRQVGYLC
jgi:RNA polymerase sigma factor (sigma-70 family)